MSDLELTLRKWHAAKEKIEELEQKVEKYKKSVSRLMNESNSDSVSAGEFKVVKRRNTRSYLSKDSVPKEIWQKYSSKTSYETLYLSYLKKK